MTHPTNEEWMSYLYGEINRTDRERLSVHLEVCLHCQDKVAEWQGALKNLDGWQLANGSRAPRRLKQSRFVPVSLKWAAALVLFAGAGFAVGRLSSSSASPEQVRAAIEPEIRQQLRQEFAQTLRQELDKTASTTLAASREQARSLLADYDAARADDDDAVSEAMNELQSQQASDYLSLKKQLD